MYLEQHKINFKYKCGDKTYYIHEDDEKVKFRKEINEDSIKIWFTPNQEIEVIKAELVWDEYYDIDARVFVNGYQSWTKSREFQIKEQQPGLVGISKCKLFKRITTFCGDYNFTKYRDGLFHSYTYTYLRKYDDLTLYGSINERTGYTVFYADVKNNQFIIEKDLEGLKTSKEYEFINVVKFTGKYDEVFDKYFANFKKRGGDLYLKGYTSWYNYYQGINEEIINRDLQALIDSKSDANIFQIDDGYSTANGDWDIDKEKFSHGLKPIVDKAHANNLKTGLWCAPFAAQKSSKFVKEKKHLLLRDKNGRLVLGGISWGGFYVLDIEKPEARDYIRKTFNRFLNEWGFDMLKLDFLYAECMIPRNGKTRGQIMCEAMEFLADCCGDKILLACGSPIGPAFGYADAMRTGSDVEKTFKDRFYVKTTNQEIVSTKTSINNSVFRRHLNNRIFALDPDVFYLREDNDGATLLRFSDTQKKLLAKVNNMFGSVLFVSDDVSKYDDKKNSDLKKYFTRFKGKVVNAEYTNEDEISVIFTEDGKTYNFKMNLVTGEHSQKELR